MDAELGEHLLSAPIAPQTPSVCGYGAGWLPEASWSQECLSHLSQEPSGEREAGLAPSGKGTSELGKGAVYYLVKIWNILTSVETQGFR